MDKVYILILPPESKEKNIPERDEVLAYLKETKAIGFWEYCLPYSLFFKSSLNSKEISELLQKKYGILRHIIVEVTKNYWGILPKGYWDLFSKET